MFFRFVCDLFFKLSNERRGERRGERGGELYTMTKCPAVGERAAAGRVRWQAAAAPPRVVAAAAVVEAWRGERAVGVVAC